MSPRRVVVSLAERMHDIHCGDVLLYRGSPIIAVAGRGEYSHAAMAGWWGNDLFCLEIREFRGGRAVTLESQVERYGGRVDVYRPQLPESVIAQAFCAMRRKCGHQYNYAGVLAAACLHLPILRFMVAPDTYDGGPPENGNRPEFCSEAVASAFRFAGVDLVPNLADRITEPNDLNRSSHLEYQFSLEP